MFKHRKKQIKTKIRRGAVKVDNRAMKRMLKAMKASPVTGVIR